MMDDSEARLSEVTGLSLSICERAWKAYGERCWSVPSAGEHQRFRGLQLSHIEDLSPGVSTNRVFRLTLNDGQQVIAKVSSYGSYVHFKQDHQLINRWSSGLKGGRFSKFLADMLKVGDEPFFYRESNIWVVFYHKTTFYDFLPKILDEAQIESLGTEMANFHLASAQSAVFLEPSWKSMGGDIATLFDVAGDREWRARHFLGDSAEGILREQCERFLVNAAQLGYHRMRKIPLLLDWNIGNFSVGLEEAGFKLFSRWDFDWFRVEPRQLDFYFCARVVRAEGDQDEFSYTVAPFFEERFIRFLRAYHRVFALSRNEVKFMKEAYRFFLLNYVIRSGEHFFRPIFQRRLQAECFENYFPALETMDFEQLYEEMIR